MTADDTHDTSTSPPGRRLGAALLAVVLLAAALPAMTTAGAAQPASDLPAEPAFLIVLEPDGSAQATLTVAFDLTTDAERNAFEALRANDSAREERVEQFASQMRSVADRAEANTGREMRIAEPTIQFIERGDTGIVALTVTWEGLAVRSGDTLVLREPFASGVTMDRAFYVVAPDGHELSSVKPTPTNRTPTTATWAPGSSLQGFEATFVPRTGADAPGFGIGTAILAILLSTGILRFRARTRS